MAKRQPASASNLLDNAKSYNALASTAVQNGTLVTASEPAFYLLIWYSIELNLKAICLHAVMAENTIKNIGHAHQSRRFRLGLRPTVLTA
jgi:hypothetical protein